MRILNKKVFSKREIEEFEKARGEIIKKIDLFQSSMPFAKECNTESIDDLKKEINEIHLEDFESSEQKVYKTRYGAILRYFTKIRRIATLEIGSVDGKIDEILSEYEKQVLYILDM